MTQPGTRVLSLGLSAALTLLSCGGGDETDQSTAELSPAEPQEILLQDGNNYQATSVLTLDSVDTAAGEDIQICWDGVLDDIQCHAVDAKADINNVALLRFRGLSQPEVTDLLSTGELTMSQIGGYIEHRVTEGSTCASLYDFTLFGTPVEVAEEYVENDTDSYLLVFTQGTTPGVGAQTMVFINPTSSSDTTMVDAPRGCGDLEFEAQLTELTPLELSEQGPWLIDWAGLTRDSQGNAVPFQKIDGVMIGWFEDFTVPQLEEQILDLELIATDLWEIELDGGRAADLADATHRSTGKDFPGFEQDSEGVWVLALTCSTCQNPAPVLLTTISPEAE